MRSLSLESDADELRAILLNRSAVNEASGCREWVGAMFPQGYGRLMIDRRPAKAHRTSFILNKGPIPVGMFVCHRCDNPKCIEPSHLFLGDDISNSADKAEKGRAKKKLDAARAAEIKRRAASGEARAALAKEFGVTKQTVQQIATDKIWARAIVRLAA